MTIFEDQKLFMDITGQLPSKEAVELYATLVEEEYTELMDAYNIGDTVGVIDGAIDLLYVTSGLLHAMGLNPQPFWDEVQRSNMSKFLLETCVFCGGEGCADCSGKGEFYKVLRREDGKILKGPSYFPPDLKKILAEQLSGKEA